MAVSTRAAVTPIAVTVAHAAELLDCSRQHVYSLCERGVLRRQRIAGSTSVRIPVADIYRALDLEVTDAAAS